MILRIALATIIVAEAALVWPGIPALVAAVSAATLAEALRGRA